MSSTQTSGETWVPGDFEHPNPGLRRSITIALVFAFTLSTLSVGLRVLARRISGQRLFLDDWLIIVALVGLFFSDCELPTNRNHSFSNMDAPSASPLVSLSRIPNDNPH